MKSFKKALLAPGLAAFLGLAMAVPATAVEQEGLVNVNVTDVGVNVQVPVTVAANVCDVSVNVLTEQQPGEATCEADAESAANNQQFMRLAEEQGQAEAIREAV